MKNLLPYFAGLCVLSVALFLPFNNPTLASSPAAREFSEAKSNLKDDEVRIFALVNQERHRSRLGEMSWNDDLAEIARDYSRKMAKGNFFSHYDNNGKGVADRVNDAKIKNWLKVGENLFVYQGLDEFDVFAVKNWMKSPMHRQNILDRAWTESGIGIAESKDGKIYVTQVFMRR